MLFNSLAFLVFFPVTTLIYFLLPHRFRWLHLLACSCLFYASFIPAYLLILAGVIAVDYLAGLGIERARGPARKALLAASLLANIGLLAAFKYFDFFNGSVRALAVALHWNYPVRDLGWLLPIGLSFHTFQSMSYTIEVYRGRQRAERHFGIYALYVLFYPQLVAGPIERPQNLLHQFRENHAFDADRVFSGLRLMLWGLFKKLVVADRVAPLVDLVYKHPQNYGGGWLVAATYLFAIQIYCDFSGYSDVAIGAARVLGFRLMTNFDRPYASASVAEFWRRWHISLSTWFRDYLYIPLGGNRVPPARWAVNVMIVFLVSGLWHGANWTYLVWGGLHGFYLIASRAVEAAWARVVPFDNDSSSPHAGSGGPGSPVRPMRIDRDHIPQTSPAGHPERSEGSLPIPRKKRSFAALRMTEAGASGAEAGACGAEAGACGAEAGACGAEAGACGAEAGASALSASFTLITKLLRGPAGRALRRCVGVLVTFHLVAVAWVFFRADSVSQAGWILTHLGNGPWLAHPGVADLRAAAALFEPTPFRLALGLVLAMELVQWAAALPGAAQRWLRQPAWVRWPAYYALILCLLLFGDLGARTFIYFQF